MDQLINKSKISEMILLFRGKRVLLDSDLANLYGVGTRDLNKSVTRNKDRFPNDFMFRLTQQEFGSLMFQNGTSKTKGGRRKLPRVFTEQGVAMLSGVLRSKEAIKVNIAIMRAFVQVNQIIRSNIEVFKKLQKIEDQMNSFEDNSGERLVAIYETLQELVVQTASA